jgi:N-acetylglutamate synthase-like GNAT family acetyltransferase
MGELVEPGPERHRECLQVLRDGFGTQVAEFGITPDNDPDYPAYWDECRIENLVARPATLLAVETDGRMAGCCFVGASRRWAGVWTLRHLAVTPAARHRGYGGLLVAGAADRARSAGAARLRIGIIGENVRLSDWYHRLGFVTVDAGNRYGSLPFMVDHLELTLAGPSAGVSARIAAAGRQAPS